MIRQSYIFLEKINSKTEKNIWKQGIKDWEDFLNSEKIKGIGEKRKLYYNRRLLEARNALYNFNSSYFIDKLPPKEMWRLYDFFRDDTIFLDIETSGVTKHDDVTVIGLFDGFDTKIMIKNINLGYKLLKKELKNYKLIVTFNGSSFDIPFIKKRYPDLLPNIPHFDIHSVCHRVGLTGGLKEIEKKFGIKRNPIVEKMYGGDPLRLWKIYRATGDDYYLKLLIEYNEEDVINLKKITEYCVQELKLLFLKMMQPVNRYSSNTT